jgi:hypothetical protein
VSPTSRDYPGGKRFAFSIIDDTDVATVENVRPIYDLFARLGLRTTKTIWPVGCPEGSRNFSSSQTLDDPAYLAWVQELRRQGFEITWHGATMESSRRERTLEALARFNRLFGEYPRIHANHSYNRDNVYWGGERIDQPLLRALYRRFHGAPDPDSFGHRPATDYFWGDHCARHIQYARNLTFNEINLARVNPSMPYHDPRRPLVRWWFSASDAEDCGEFNALLSSANQERLEREGGFCIVATHLGKGFVRNGEVHPGTRERLEELARRPGWFPTVGELLDYLRVGSAGRQLPRMEWQAMQWRWARDLAARRWRARNGSRAKSRA